MNTLESIIRMKEILKDEVTTYRAPYGPMDPYAVLLHNSAHHFTERFIERVSSDEEVFRKVIRAFLGMLQVRRKFFVDYVARNPTFNEHTYVWKGYEIKYATERGIRNPLDDEGRCAVVRLSTIIKK